MAEVRLGMANHLRRAAGAAAAASRRQGLARHSPAHAPTPSPSPAAAPCARHTQVAVAATARVPGSRQLVLTLDRCEFYGNAVNVTGALAAQAGLDVTLRLLDSGERKSVPGGRGHTGSPGVAVV